MSGSERFGLAVSGGPDSLALLLLAEAAHPGRFAVAAVDHGLRAEGAGEAALVARICGEREIACATLRPAVARTGNLAANARSARYAALGAWAKGNGLAALLTAHHRDDQAETVLMRLNRGSGVRGLAGMRAAAVTPGHPDLPLLRPLLGWTRGELGAVVAAAGLVAADDPSNRDPRFERAALRARLATADWLDPAALAASAAHLADADAALEWAAEQEWAAHVARDEPGLAYRPAAPRAIRLRVIGRIIAELAHEGAPRGREIARLADRLEAGVTATLAGVRAAPSAGLWRFTAAAPRRTG